MKKIVFAIFAALLMTALTFGAISATAKTTSVLNASDCVPITGVVEGTYSTVNPCTTQTIRLEGIEVTITDNTFGTVNTVTTSFASKKFLIIPVPGGEFSAEVYKNLDYTISIDATINIDGFDYKFEDSQTVSVGETGASVSFNIHGELVKPESKSFVKMPMIQNILNRLVERYSGIFSFF